MANVNPDVIPMPLTQAAQRQYSRRPGSGIVVIAVMFSLLSLLPLGFVIGIAIDTGWPTVKALVFRPRVGELLLNTALLVAITLPLCAIIGVALAWLTERTALPGRRIWSLLAIAPLAVPAFVQSYAWISLVPSMHGLGAGVFISVIAYFPFIYLPASAVLRRLDPGLEDAAASLGSTPGAVFFRVVLPQLKLAVWGGSILIALHLLAEYGLYAMIRFDTFTTAIFDQFQSTFNGPAANMLAGVLALCCLGLLLIEATSRGYNRYARVGSGSARRQTAYSMGTALTLWCLLLPLAMTALSLGVPFITLTRWLYIGGFDVWLNADLLPALKQTLALALSGAVMITLCAIPMAWLSVRYPGRLHRVMEGCNYVTSSLPGIVVALALVTITIRIARPLYQTEFTLLLAYLLMFTPRALISLRAGIATAPVELENVARSLGKTPTQAIWSTTMRLAAPGAAAGAALVFLAISNELTATLLLAPNGTRTLATGFWALTSEIDYVAASPYALLMVALSLPLTWLLYSQSQRTAGL